MIADGVQSSSGMSRGKHAADGCTANTAELYESLFVQCRWSGASGGRKLAAQEDAHAATVRGGGMRLHEANGQIRLLREEYSCAVE